MSASPENRLDSWKEIAAYLNRGVRTVRRWEREEGLPVHRHVHRVLGSVYAYKSEIESWRQTGRRSSAPSRAAAGRASLTIGPSKSIVGSVRRAGDRLRITAQLIDAATDDHLWADKYDGSVADVFVIQERLARVIVDALELRLTAAEDRRLATRPIGNVHAYDCYLRARQEAWRWRTDAIAHAIQLLHNGLALVGDNARLYAALGHAHLQYREAGIDLGEHPLDEAEDCARRVFALEPAAASGLQLRGWIH